LENADARERTDVRSLEIEHIMPQNERLNESWKQMLGPNWREIQQRWLHRLGNLTLTGYNSTYSDRAFQMKKTMKKGFAESAVRLNKYVREQDTWTEQQLQERTELLVAEALRIWPPLHVDPEALNSVQRLRIQQRAARRNVETVPMSPAALQLFSALRPRILEMAPGIIEMAESKSVSYHAPAFFLEVIPRINSLTLLFPLQFSELSVVPQIASDASEWQFIVNSKHSGGVLARVKSPEDIGMALPLLHQALKAVQAEP